MATKPAYYMVVESFITVLDGREVEYTKGEVVEVDDPAVKARPAYFGPMVVRSANRGVEQATAAPGEKRA